MKFKTSAEPVRIDVNENGGYVTLHLESDAFVKNFFSWVNKCADGALNHKDKAQNSGDEVDELISYEKEVKTEFENLFGAGAYEATFGCDLVGVEYVIEFIEFCLPFFEKAVNNRQKAIAKYSSDRMGGAK